MTVLRSPKFAPYQPYAAKTVNCIGFLAKPIHFIGSFRAHWKDFLMESRAGAHPCMATFASLYLFQPIGNVSMRKLLWLAILVTPCANAQSDEELDKIMLAAYCAASSALVGSKTEGFAGEMIIGVAKTWREELVRRVSADAVFADQVIAKVAKQFQSEYNSGNMSWEQLVDVSQSCAEAIN